jgi:asparagine N-glycosylation enzyme membrane subunit Stt3
VIIGDVENVGGGCSFPALADAPQAGTDALIEVNDRRALDAVWRDNGLWMVMSIDATGPCDPFTAGVTKAHWVAMDTSGGSGAIFAADGGTLGGDDISSADATTFFPAIAVNAYGDAAVGFSASSPDMYAGAFAAKRLAGDAPGTFGSTQTIKAGEDYYLRTFGGSRNRWGDYSGIALDPSNQKFFWAFNLYAAPRSDEPDSRGEDGRWGTAWGRVK